MPKIPTAMKDPRYSCLNAFAVPSAKFGPKKAAMTPPDRTYVKLIAFISGGAISTAENL
jgi:hypothetical protein